MSKTITLYKYMSMQYALDTIKKNRLYMNDGSTFNDPFELTFVNSLTKQNEQVEGLHILCLTNSHRKKLMWSHYADSHKGICLTVEIAQEYVRPVIYTTERVLDNNVDCIIEKFQQDVEKSKSKAGVKRNVLLDYSTFSTNKKIAYIKDKKWAYEKEYRIVFESDDGMIEKEDDKWYFKVKIKNVYLGCKFEHQLQKEFLNECKKNRIRISEVIKSTKNYELLVP